MPRQHGDRGEFVETTTLDDVLAVFEKVDGPVIVSSDVAEIEGCTTQTARRKLGQLYDRGDVDRRDVGRQTVYWRAD